MNKARRRQIDGLLGRLSELVVDIESIAEDEENGWCNLPDSLQYGDAGEQMQEHISNLNNAAIEVAEAMTTLEAVTMD